MRGRQLAQRYAQGFIPRIVPLLDASQWQHLNKRPSEIRALDRVARQVITLNASLTLGLHTSVELVRRRIAYAKRVRSRYCPPRKLPVDDLIDQLTALVWVPDPQGGPRSGPRLSDLRSLLDDLVRRRVEPGPGVKVEGRMIVASTASLAAHLGCSKSTVHAALQWLGDRRIVALEPGASCTKVWVIRLRGELVSGPRAHPMMAAQADAKKISPPVLCSLYRSRLCGAIARLAKKVAALLGHRK